MPESKITLYCNSKFIIRSQKNKLQGSLDAHHLNNGAAASAKATHVTLAATKFTCGRASLTTQHVECVAAAHLRVAQHISA